MFVLGLASDVFTLVFRSDIIDTAASLCAMNLVSVEHTHTLHSPSTQRQHLTQSGKVTKLIFKNDFHSPPLENNPVYEYIDYSRTSRYTIFNTFITIPNTK